MKSLAELMRERLTHTLNTEGLRAVKVELWGHQALVREGFQQGKETREECDRVMEIFSALGKEFGFDLPNKLEENLPRKFPYCPTPEDFKITWGKSKK